ncbi:hypothetical protein Ddc_07659 [Ditylenchus destructor]|nr:hypothetical protein Ddc_07659 [Ditylenchus destructor]
MSDCPAQREGSYLYRATVLYLDKRYCSLYSASSGVIWLFCEWEFASVALPPIQILLLAADEVLSAQPELLLLSSLSTSQKYNFVETFA